MPSIVLIDVTKLGVLTLKLLRDKKVIKEKNKKGRRLNLLFFLDSFLKENNLSWNKIKGLVLLEGEGSFSGVRQAVAVLNILVLAKKIKVIGLDIKKNSTNEKLILEIEKKFNHPASFIKPLYGGEPNITLPRQKN
ncbi:MAG: hypothetical protein UT86_C0003G0063 [Candidatus Magasanikbacteria bacterium GW2011_GWC2_40_17]|uniref:Gcp-like domain-containing protein n=1 Tax=Candidatus Magasanikbacteria bacterium GW2011_GWA2_42_32 TaxID=1619039 RepID=A0A0G1CE48_9BACT|nr:MAG: hypothetical protein UT86_C0003G0063 [Candidatus Magasanikbacteria bacterium GW2011_GWC2_40_17]KKS56966.1 MAG: hypothetical protein UV20_C0004G0062 [Candidatus Magasanikbacteria bacterium GW2011_GWA2_42_32]OGH85696.1 MAG: hypothetical protein A2294_03655 [Candidatus Magasanikbacteria bacterium RIFOXYB2_FULL_38_10]